MSKPDFLQKLAIISITTASILTGFELNTSSAQALSIVPTNDQDELVNQIVNGAVPTFNIQSTIAPGAAGTFTDGGFPSGIGIEEGIILTTGQAVDAVGPNSSDFTSTDNGFPGDPDLCDICGEDTFDATILQFDFTAPTSGKISFDYVFASEEYNEFVGSQFNDIFVFFLNGVDIALIPETTTPIEINTVNNITNPEFFIDNELPDAPFTMVEYDGFTTVLSAEGFVPAGTNTIRLAIADASDAIYDSAVFIEKGSFDFKPVPEPGTVFGLLAVGALGLGLKRKKEQA